MILISWGLSCCLSSQTETNSEIQTIFLSCTFLFISLSTSSQRQLPSRVLFCFYGMGQIDLLWLEQDNLPLASYSEQQKDKFLSVSQISVLQNNTSTPKQSKSLPIQRERMSERAALYSLKPFFILSAPSFPLRLYTVYNVNTDPF